ncbi:helix-turn-helix transcriptional regulator [Herbiconiux moechotypicola]|uniref:HTH araC/xylS-type domain-containing protein n=1 Tax=Herbiconiux moechotypicola TaxID=637393 RepID=A0ABN3DX24_9MICO|nr:helix-turn-helix transcriptional regulator [Herbiconiux moechotypicola]MCS5730783.1 helix-turn-helix transcriptional regulator [Herbiconiux moechotypicola]
MGATISSASGSLPRPPVERFSIGALGHDEGLQVITEAAHRSLVPFDLATVDAAEPVVFDLASRGFGEFGMADMTIRNVVSERTEKLARDQSEPQLSLMVLHGAARLEQGGRQLRGRDGSICATWSIRPWRTAVSARAELSSLTLSLDRVGLPNRLLGGLVGRDLGTAPLAPVLRAHLAALAALPALDRQADAAVTEPTAALVRALLATAAGDDAVGRGALRETLGMRVMQHLRSNVTDPELSAESIATRFSISRRTLYLVLAELDVPLGEWVRTERLRRAAAALHDPACADLGVSAVARRCGFTEHSTFSRAFRTRYGVTPSEWRAAAADSVHSGHSALHDGSTTGVAARR